MHNDSLAARLFEGHDYARSLVGTAEEMEANDAIKSISDVPSSPTFSFFDNLADFFSSLPSEVYAIISVVVMAYIIYLLYSNGLLRVDYRAKATAMDNPDNPFEIEYDKEMSDALKRDDFAALVRLVYLRTLKFLDEEGRISWRIYKTPTDYASEMLMPAFSTMTLHFMRVRYGRFQADSSLYNEMRLLQEQVQKGGQS